jgi:hypothetical protein
MAKDAIRVFQELQIGREEGSPEESRQQVGRVISRAEGISPEDGS